MRLVSLTIRNFLSFGDTTQALDLGNRGLVLIEGENKDDPTVQSNGSGKSALLEALVWVLFGKTIRGLTGDKVVNNTVGKNCAVTLDLEVGDKSYQIARYRKHAQFGSKLRFYSLEDGGATELTRSDSADTQEDINKLIGLTYDTFVNSVVFGQGVTKHFASMTDKEQKVVMDKLIGLERLSAAHQAAKDELSRVERKLEDLHLEELSTAVEVVEGELADAQQDNNEWATGRSIRILGVENEIKRLTAEAKADVSVKLSEAKAAEESQRAKLTKAAAALGAAEQALETAKKATRKVLDGVSGGKCEVCGSTIKASELARHRSELGSAVEEATQEYKAALAVKDDLEADVDHWSDEVDDLEEQHRKAQSAQRMLDRLKEDKRVLEEESNPYTRRVSGLADAVEEAKKALAKAKKDATKLNREKAHLDFLVNMLSDKGTKELPPLKGCLLDNVTPFLNAAANRFSRAITGGNIEIAFETQRELSDGSLKEEFSVTAKNLYGADAYDGNSGGEKRKIDLCVALALQSLGASRHGNAINVAFYDEVFESLDDAAVDRVMDLLKEEAKTKDSLFVVTHLASLKSAFESTITVAKEHGISTLK